MFFDHHDDGDFLRLLGLSSNNYFPDIGDIFGPTIRCYLSVIIFFQNAFFRVSYLPQQKSCVQLVDYVGGWTAVEKHYSFSIKSMYQKLCVVHVKVPWRRVICNNQATPKSQFIMWLTLWGRLPTLDRLFKWNIAASDKCPVCTASTESVWQKVLKLLQFSRPPGGFTSELQWVIKSSKMGELLMMFFAECIYSVWLNRNDKVLNQHCKTPTY
ncbi:uncharacterized protein [Spinacia oleracea]|uniref:Reverse transcriptase zinc-binding domain-containing protein n=1 Tax=Spinacia oleracea TaxID=3562 RepID=A0A9R0JET8_SPIOL|nr:uncharacterized protein LOC110803963 [Spinacia oleracea]